MSQRSKDHARGEPGDEAKYKPIEYGHYICTMYTPAHLQYMYIVAVSNGNCMYIAVLEAYYIS